MAREETLFHPIPQQRKAAGTAAGPALRMEVDPDEERESLLETMTFASRAARRRKPLTVLVLVLGLVLTLVAEYLAPRTYEVEARVLVLRSGLAAALMGSNNNITPDEKRDAKEYEEQIRSRSNIEAIVRDCKLVERWDQNLSPVRRMIDRFGPKIGRPVPTTEAKFNTLAAVLEKQLKVTIDTSTVIISVDWPDPELAHDIIHAAVEKFTAARYATEVGVIPDSIAILERYADEARVEMERASTNMRHPNGQAPAVAAPPPPAHDTHESHESSHAAPGPTKLDPATGARLAEVQAQIRTITDDRDRRLNELNAQLTEMSTTYAPAHPAVVALKATIDATRQDPPALVQLRSDEAALMGKAQTDDSSRHAVAHSSSRHGDKPDKPEAAAPVTEAQTADPTGESQDRFEASLRRFEALRNRIDEAKIEERTADANFNHRYQVVHPAEYPLGPKSPTTLLVGVGGSLLTMLMILVAAAVADLLAGVFYEPRRVRDRLKLPVLGEGIAEG
jgi:uncharacterized protein involved in exopolysaccharide biosynthesis